MKRIMKKSKKYILPKAQISKENLDHASKEAKMDRDFVQNIITKEGYSPISKSVDIGAVSDLNFLKSKFSCHYNLDKFNDVAKSKQHFVTGFGPTNPPTGGTLSMILRAIFFERETGIDSTIIISNLGAFNSRNIALDKIGYLTERFIKFIRYVGFKGELRTHNNFNLLVASSLTSKVLTTKDFLENEEATIDLYKKLGIQGKDFPTFVDANFTVADILLPCILEKKERILVFVGIEEYYFPKLANLVIQRFNKNYQKQFVPENALVTATFGHLIGGLKGFPKMSKSIPESSINLDDPTEKLEQKILECDPKDEKIILQMINLVSDWDLKKINKANAAFQSKSKDWSKFKSDYFKYFISLKDAWEKTENKEYKFKVDSLFKSSL
jgi:tryptophanyl-tRNA synthetase